MDKLRGLLLKAEKPARYVGGEYGAPAPDGRGCNFCLCFPDLYEVGMSNLGIKIVAESLLRRGHTADFCFAPYKDFGAGLKKEGVPLYSLSLKKPLKEFDIIGFSVQYELCFTNLLYMLDLAGIPLTRKERAGGRYPLVAVGGPCAVNPEPLADFIDLAFIGDGESVDADVADLFLKYGATEKFLREAVKLDGVYAPALGNKVKRAVIRDLDGAVFPESFAVPNCESVHDRAVIEVMRGCYNGCRFCQAGFIYRPVRTRSVETLTGQACSLIKRTGYGEVSLNSLSTGDYPKLKELIKSLKGSLPQGVTLALPSLRVDSFDRDFAQDARKISVTFAPEAGSRRLRDVINKNVTEEEILRAAESAFDIGYSAVKLYFMLGLPTETDEDIRGIGRICALIKDRYKSKPRAKGLRVSVSCSTFVPKPFTPFQWERQASEEEIKAKRGVLLSSLKTKGATVSWSDDFTARLEAAFARGDRRLCGVLRAAYENGCVFDGWGKELNREGWLKAFDAAGVSLDEYTRARDENETLPWDYVDVGVTKKFLLEERKKAYAATPTQSCKSGCNGCGLQAECGVAGGRK